MMTFSLRPEQRIVLALDRRIGEDARGLLEADAAERNDSVASDALVTPSSTGPAVRRFFLSVGLGAFVVLR